MDDTPYLLAVTLVAAVVTSALRALPFAILAPLRTSKLLPYLAEGIPVGVMVILTVYTLRHVSVTDPKSDEGPDPPITEGLDRLGRATRTYRATHPITPEPAGITMP